MSTVSHCSTCTCQPPESYGAQLDRSFAECMFSDTARKVMLTVSAVAAALFIESFVYAPVQHVPTLYLYRFSLLAGSVGLIVSAMINHFLVNITNVWKQHHH